MSTQDLINFYESNLELLDNHTPIMGMLRIVGFWLIKILAMLAHACERLYDITFGLIDFTSNPTVNSWVDKFYPLFVALMAVSIFALGIMLIFNSKKKPKILVNICIAILCVTCSTLCFTELNNVVKDLKAGIDTVSSEVAADNSYDIITNNLYDICYMDKNLKNGLRDIDYDNNKASLPQYQITKEKINAISYDEVLDPGNDNYNFKDSDAKNILTHGIMVAETDGNYKVKELYDGVAWTSINNEYYFRYQLDFIPVLLQLISAVIIYLAMSYKCTRIAYELITARLLAYLVSSELSGGERIAKLLYFIRDSYILLLLTTVCIKIYYLFSNYLTSVSSLQNNTLLTSIILLFLAFCVIDGPNVVERILGMDVGLKSSTARMLAALHLANNITGASKLPSKAMNKIHSYQDRKNVENAMKNNSNAKHSDSLNNGMNTNFMNSNSQSDNKDSGLDTNFMNSNSQSDNKDSGLDTNFMNSNSQSDNKDSGEFNTSFMRDNSRNENGQINEGSSEGISGLNNSEVSKPDDNKNGFNTDFMNHGKGNSREANNHSGHNDDKSSKNAGLNKNLNAQNGNKDFNTSFMDKNNNGKTMGSQKKDSNTATKNITPNREKIKPDTNRSETFNNNTNIQRPVNKRNNADSNMRKESLFHRNMKNQKGDR